MDFVLFTKRITLVVCLISVSYWLLVAMCEYVNWHLVNSKLQQCKCKIATRIRRAKSEKEDKHD